MKKVFALLLALCMVLSLAACGKKTAAEGSAAPAASGEAAAEKTSVALVVADSFGDRSFYDSSKEGAERLQKDQGITLNKIECGGVDHDEYMRKAADGNDIVVCVGWEFYNIGEIAAEYPDVKWIWIDNALEESVPNVLCITYAQNEGSFLAGYAAAGVSETGVVAAVGAEDAAVINDFIVGYKQGAEYYGQEHDTSITALSNYVGGDDCYNDPARGKESAIALHDKKADVVFQIASASGDGVFEAAAEKGFYAIGVDSDQKFINEDVIICSMEKHVGDTIYDAISEFLAGDTSKLGTEWIADMSNGYVGIGYGEEGSKQQISDELKAEIEAVAAKIMSGEIKVDTTR